MGYMVRYVDLFMIELLIKIYYMVYSVSLIWLLVNHKEIKA